MPFTVTILKKFNETCDDCGKHDERDLIEIRQSSRQDRHIIWVHEDCFLKRLTRARIKAEKEAALQVKI